MLAVKLHPTPKPKLVKGAFLIPIVDWKSGSVQIRTWLRWMRGKRYITLVRIPDDHPVRICFTYGNSNFIKQVCWPMEFLPMKDWPRDYVKAISEWWDAWRQPRPEDEIGGLMVDEPRLFLGRKLPADCIKWTKSLQLLYRKPNRRRPPEARPLD